MALTETSTINITVLGATGHLQVQRVTTILRDGEPWGSPALHRYTLAPGDDLTGQDPDIISHATTAWTPERIAAEQARQAEIAARQPVDEPAA